MQTLEDRLRVWQQELLDLTNRNRLLSFTHATVRSSTLRLEYPEPQSILDALEEGKRLTIVGTETSDEVPPEDANGADISGQPFVGPAVRQSGFARSWTGELQQVDQASLIRQSPTSSDSSAVNRTETVPSSQGSDSLAAGREEAAQSNIQDDPEFYASEQIKLAVQKPIASTQTSFTPERTNQVSHRLHDRARASELEQGINTLFAVFGRLKWQEHQGEPWRYAPLVLVPVRVEESVRESAYRLVAADEDSVFNQTLSERMRRDFGINVSFDYTAETPLTQIFDAVRKAVASQPEWEVIEDVHVGILHFHKIRMFWDLSEHAGLALQHPIIQALGLSDVVIASPTETGLSEDELDQTVAPEESFAFLDADASQLRAVQLARRGSHLIIHGPPGTGKSQTIANIISECLARGKTVLFVSEKAAAIEVVQRRLAEHGLGGFCLMLHSHKANKRDIISELGRRLEGGSSQLATPQEDIALRRLATTRASLNNYAEALHRPRGDLQASAYWGFGEFARVAQAPRLTASLPTPPATLTHSQLDLWAQLLANAGRYEAILRAGDSHPWAWLQPAPLSLAQRETLQRVLSELVSSTDTVRSLSHDLADKLNLPRPGSLPEVRHLQQLAADIPADGDLLRIWFNPTHMAAARSLAEAAATQAAAAASSLERLSSAYADSILTIATNDAIGEYQRGRIPQLISKQFRAIRFQVRTAALDGQQRSPDVELTYLRDALAVREHMQWFRNNETRLVHELGVPISETNPPRTESLMSVLRRLDAADAIKSHLPPGSMLQDLLDVICHDEPGKTIVPQRDLLAASVDELEALLEQLRPFCSTDPVLDDGAPLNTSSMEALRAWAETRGNNLDSLGDWLQSHIAMTSLRQAGLNEVMAELLGRQIPASEWNAAFKRRVLTHWLDMVIAESEDLQQFSVSEHEDRIQQFRQLDRTCLRWAPVRIRRALEHRNGNVAASQGGEPGTLRREVQKRRRHLPLRQLFARIPNLLLRLKPCLMMSPLSVAQFLPANLYKFDVVIFDEASQVRPFDAIGAIVRGTQLIVAGDSKQLPPTTFFEREVVEEEDDDEDLGSLESILDALTAKNMPSTRLRWHYRSRHETLIAFSNHHFYDHELVTFPSPTAKQPPLLGVHHEFVPDGSYDGAPSKKVNRNEAHRVVELVMQHARERPGESLGVVTLNANQTEEIKLQFDKTLKQNPMLDDFFREDRQEPFFIKPLELVQGDERDVIIISVGFGKKNPRNPAEHLSHNFGPINRDGGERRLNVLVTRARHQIILVSSIRAADIDLNRTQKLGPRLLKNYLDFAERGPVAIEAQVTSGDGDYESPFEEAVGTTLERIGYRVGRQIGVSRYRIDLAIVDPDFPGSYLLGIECDGRTYHSSKTARDRDRLRQEHLEQLGWTIHRVWSTDWIREPDRELNRIIARISQVQEAKTRPDAPPPQLMPYLESPAPNQEIEPPAATNSDPTESAVVEEPSAQPYTIADIPVRQGTSFLYAPIGELVRAIEKCVSLEGPVHWDVVSRRIASAWQIGRIGSQIEERLNLALDVALESRSVERDGAFLWPYGGCEPTPRGRLPNGKPRLIQHISDEELLMGMTLVLRQALSLSAEELVVSTSRFFEYRRTGKEISERLQQVIIDAVARRVIVGHGDRYRMPR